MNRIKQLREAKGLTQAKLGSLLHVKAAAVSKYESESVPLTADTLRKLAEVFNVSVDYLLGITASNKDLDFARVPVYAAIVGERNIFENESVDFEDVPANWVKDGAYFGLKVSGDSMYPKYLNDDTALVHVQDSIDNTHDCVVTVGGEDAMIRKLTRHDDGGITLRPINVAYPPRTYTRAERNDLPVRILGIVVELRRPVGQG